MKSWTQCIYVTCVFTFLLNIHIMTVQSDSNSKEEDDDWSSWDEDEDITEKPNLKRWNRQGLCDHDAMTSVILRIILDIRDSMKTGDPTLGVPPLDPVGIPKIQIEQTGIKHKFGIKADLTNVVVRELSKFTILDIQSNLIELEANFSLQIDTMTIHGDYNLRGIVRSPMPLPIFGNGKFLLAPKQAKIAVFSKFGYKDGILELLSFDFDIKLLDLFVKFDGIWGAGRNLNAIVNSFGLKAFNKMEPTIHEKVRQRGLHEINKILIDLKYDEEFVMELLNIPLRCYFG